MGRLCCPCSIRKGDEICCFGMLKVAETHLHMKGTVAKSNY